MHKPNFIAYNLSIMYVKQRILNTNNVTKFLVGKANVSHAQWYSYLQKYYSVAIRYLLLLRFTRAYYYL